MNKYDELSEQGLKNLKINAEIELAKQILVSMMCNPVYTTNHGWEEHNRTYEAIRQAKSFTKILKEVYDI